MRSLLLILLYCTITTYINAQSVSWSQDFSEGSSYNNVQFTETDAEGNTYFAGYFSSNIIINGQHYVLEPYKRFGIFLVKLNSAGQYLWTRVIQGGKELKGLDTDESGNTIITIYADADTLKLEDGSFHLPSWGTLHGKDVFLFKFDSNGEHQWTKCTAKPLDRPYGDGTYPQNTYFDADGNIFHFGVYYVSMSIDSTVLYGEEFRPNMYVSKFSPDGKLVWLKKLPGMGFYYGDGMLDDGLLLFIYRSEIYTFTKLDFDGHITLDREFKKDSTKGPVSIAARGRYIYAAAIIYDRKDWLNDYHKLLITKLDAEGNIIWEKGLRKSNQNQYIEQVPTVSFVRTDKLGNLYIIGSGPHYWGYSSNKIATFENHRLDEGDQFIARLNPEGKTEWLQKFPRQTAPAIYSLTSDDNEGISISGVLHQGGETIIAGNHFYRNDGDQNLGYAAKLNISDLPVIPSGNNPIVAVRQEYTLLQPNRLSISAALSSVDTSRFTIQPVNMLTSKGMISLENNIFWYTPLPAKTGLDTVRINIYNNAGVNQSAVEICINIKDSLKILKDYSIVNPNLGLRMNLFDAIENPNEGLLRIDEEDVKMPEMGTIDLSIDGTLTYRAYNATGKDTLGIRITSYDPRLENDLPISIYLNYVFDIRTDIITGIPNIPGAERTERISFSPNPITAEAVAKVNFEGCNQITAHAINAGGKSIPVPFTLSTGSIRIYKNILPAGYYIIVIRSCKKVYVDKVIVL